MDIKYIHRIAIAHLDYITVFHRGHVYIDYPILACHITERKITIKLGLDLENLTL